MTTPIDEAPAGQEIDSLIADVLGWRKLNDDDLPGKAWETQDGDIKTWEMTSYGRWQPSISITAAWGLVEEMGIRCSPSLYQIAKWYCNFLVDGKRIEASASTAPLAICRTYLKAKGITEI